MTSLLDPSTVIYIEDDPTVRFGSTQALQLAGLHVEAFGSAEEALPTLVPGINAVLLTDVKLPGIDGITVLERARQLDPDLPVILVTGHGDISMAVSAMRLGAYDFIEKPFSAERLIDVVKRAIERRRLGLEVAALRTTLSRRDLIDAKLVGQSSAMVKLRQLILDIASTDADVLIVGETGTGKELVARCLHDYGASRSGHFSAINCSAVPPALFESEVFGHTAGAFTGASSDRIGKIEHADGGTLFLDEIDEMPIGLQAKLLRVLQERQYERLGSNEQRDMSCRVIAAAKSDLSNPAASTPFRSDLYYRLSVVVLKIPALRDRREDIPALFNHFLLLAAKRYDQPVPQLSQEHVCDLLAQPWPGNVRELRNAAERLVLGLAPDTLPSAPGAGYGRLLDEQVANFERQLIVESMLRCNGHAASASEQLGIPKKTLYDKMKRLGISIDDFRGPATERRANAVGGLDGQTS